MPRPWPRIFRRPLHAYAVLPLLLLVVWHSPFMHFQANMPVSRMRMRPWLENMINSNTIDGLRWVDEVRGPLAAAPSLGVHWTPLKSCTHYFHLCFCSIKQCSPFPGSMRPDMAGRLKRMPTCSSCGPSTQVSNSSPDLQPLQEQQMEDFNWGILYLQENTWRAKHVTRRRGKPTSAVQWIRCPTSRR